MTESLSPTWLRQGCVHSPLLFSVFFSAILLVALSVEILRDDAVIVTDLAYLQEQPPKVGPETALECTLMEGLRAGCVSGKVVLCWVLVEQALLEHISDNYNNRYIIVVL